MRGFPARLDDGVYAELKRRSETERKSMNAVLNESLERHFRGQSDAKAALLRALESLEQSERRTR